MNTLILVLATDSACLFLGFVFGRLTRATVEIEGHMATEEDPSVPVVVPERKRRVTGLQLVAAGVVVIGLITALIGFSVTRNQDRLAGCVVGYSNASSAAFKARSRAQNEVNNQVDNVFAAFLAAFSDTPSEGRKRVFDAIDGYNKARIESKKTQKENPLPDPPEDACAELLD